jgi:hypothetical protein
VTPCNERLRARQLTTKWQRRKETLERLSTDDDHRYGEYYGEALHHLIGLGYVKISVSEPLYPADNDGALKRSLSLTVTVFDADEFFVQFVR